MKKIFDECKFGCYYYGLSSLIKFQVFQSWGESRHMGLCNQLFKQDRGLINGINDTNNIDNQGIVMATILPIPISFSIWDLQTTFHQN